MIGGDQITKPMRGFTEVCFLLDMRIELCAEIARAYNDQQAERWTERLITLAKRWFGIGVKPKPHKRNAKTHQNLKVLYNNKPQWFVEDSVSPSTVRHEDFLMYWHRFTSLQISQISMIAVGAQYIHSQSKYCC